MFTITIGRKRATAYREGGVEFERQVRGIGWCLDTEDTDKCLLSLVLAARRVAYPDLHELCLDDLED